MRHESNVSGIDPRAGSRRVWRGEGRRFRPRAERRRWRFGPVQLRVTILAVVTAAIAWSLLLG